MKNLKLVGVLSFGLAVGFLGALRPATVGAGTETNAAPACSSDRGCDAYCGVGAGVCIAHHCSCTM